MNSAWRSSIARLAICITAVVAGGIGAGSPERNDGPFEAEHGKIPHRFSLTPGKNLTVEIDPMQLLHRVNKLVGGVSFHRLAGWAGYPYDRAGNYTLTPDVEEKIRDLRLPLTRFYALGEEQFPGPDGRRGGDVSLDAAIDRAAVVVTRLGIPQDMVVLELEDQGARSKLSDSIWADAVRYSLSRGYGFRYWEIGNEPSVSGSVFTNPQEYVYHFNRVSSAINRIQPAARIIISVHQDDTRFGKDILAAAAGHYDLVAPHWYSYTTGGFEETVLGGNAETVRRIKKLDEYLRTQNPGRSIGQFDTEWGLLNDTQAGEIPEYNVQNANIVGTAFRAVRLIYYVNDNLMTAASGWEMLARSPAYGCCIMASGPPVRECMLYWLYYFFNRMVGDWTVAGRGEGPEYTIMSAGSQSGRKVPETPTLATVSNDGKTLFLLVVNASWTRSCSSSFSVLRSSVASADGVVLTDDNLDGIPVVTEKTDFVRPLSVDASSNKVQFVLPPHAIVFVQVHLGQDEGG